MPGAPGKPGMPVVSKDESSGLTTWYHARPGGGIGGIGKPRPGIIPGGGIIPGIGGMPGIPRKSPEYRGENNKSSGRPGIIGAGIPGARPIPGIPRPGMRC